jgi:phage terminase large subunit-like protein
MTWRERSGPRTSSSSGAWRVSSCADFDGMQLPLRCVGVDPSVAENPKDECGIVVVGATRQRKFFERHAYVLEDASIHGSPEVWAKRAVETAKRWQAPIVAEKNQGGELVTPRSSGG